MPSLMKRLKDAALRAGVEAQKDPRLMKAAQNVAKAVESFKEGYRQQVDPENNKVLCPHCRVELPEEANFCPKCGAKVD